MYVITLDENGTARKADDVMEEETKTTNGLHADRRLYYDSLGRERVAADGWSSSGDEGSREDGQEVCLRPLLGRWGQDEGGIGPLYH